MMPGYYTLHEKERGSVLSTTR